MLGFIVTVFQFCICMHVGDVNILSISSCMGILSFLFSWQFICVFQILLDQRECFSFGCMFNSYKFISFRTACIWMKSSSLYFFICMRRTSLLFIQLTTLMCQIFVRDIQILFAFYYYLFIGFNILFAKRYAFVCKSPYVQVL